MHFFRDNPNVPSDLEQMPHLLSFLESNGTVFSNSHTPMIAHTADDSLSIYTGLYGDRHGQPVSNSYNVFNPDGTTDSATSFTYWTSPIIDTKTSPAQPSTADTAPSMTYSDTVPATGTPNRSTPAPWVPFTRAGCTVGNFSTANMVLENAAVDVPTVFGAGSPEAQETAANPDNVQRHPRSPSTSARRSTARTAPRSARRAVVASRSPTRADSLPTEPGGYHGYKALFGAKYIAPAIGGGANQTHHGYPVTDANGNLVDLDGNTAAGAVHTHARLPRLQPDGVPEPRGAGRHARGRHPGDVRLHLRHARQEGPAPRGCTSPGNALGPGDAC